MGETDLDRERDEELITIEDIIKCESFPQRTVSPSIYCQHNL